MVASDARECAERIMKERVERMDVQMKITEALDEHCAVIQQLTAMSSRIVQIASELVATLRRQDKSQQSLMRPWMGTDTQHIAAEMQGIRAHPGTHQGLLALVL